MNPTTVCEQCKQPFTFENAAIPLDGGVYFHSSCYQEYVKAKNFKNVLLEDIESTFTECLTIAKKKNNDYAGEKTTDPFKNIRGSEFVGVSPDRAILVRMMDKMSRVSNLLSQDNAVKDESINDTLNDIINYAAILKSFIKHKIK